MHEPAVVLTDLVLAILGAVLCWRLTGWGRVILGGLASAAFWGAIFHAFFPDRTATPLGFLAWLLVACSILVVAAALLTLALSILVPRASAALRQAIVTTYAVGFAGVVLLVDESFSTIVLLYGPTLVLGLAAAALEAIRTRSRGGGRGGRGGLGARRARPDVVRRGRHAPAGGCRAPSGLFRPQRGLSRRAGGGAHRLVSGIS